MSTNEITLKEAIENFLKNRKMQDGLMEARIIDAWHRTVGGYISSYTEKIFVRGDVLYVTLANNALRNELFYTRSKIVYSINGMVGKKALREIVFR
ncbi:MAG: DUF721 domain-containing protein [Bacteroidales bacterium]|nr:DUF721 domain-containing protein [Bacteroidales bacterium]